MEDVFKAFPDAFQQVGTIAACVYPQGSDGWKRVRTYLLTASKFRKARGLDPWSHRDIPNLRRELLTHSESTFDNRVMAHGRATESVARDWYARKYGKQVVELSLCVPLWDPRIGGSPDGLVWEEGCPLGPAGMIEIKCPDPEKGMYADLRDLPAEYYVPEDGIYDHIKWEHYDQMQGCMAILNRTWCDYIVYSTGDDKQHVERIPFNKDYWWGELYPDLCRFMRELSS